MKPEKITMENVTQEHLDLLNAFLLGVVPTFTRSRQEQSKIASDATAEIAWALLDKKPKASWNESDADFIAQLYQNFRDGLTGVRIFLNEVSAVASTKTRNANQESIDAYVKDKVSAERTKAFAVRDSKPAKRGAPRLTPEEKQIRSFRSIGMAWDAIRATMEANVALGMSKLSASQINTILEASQKSEASKH